MLTRLLFPCSLPSKFIHCGPDHVYERSDRGDDAGYPTEFTSQARGARDEPFCCQTLLDHLFQFLDSFCVD